MSRFLRRERAVRKKKGKIIFKNEGTLPFVVYAYSFNLFIVLNLSYLMDTSGEALFKCPVDPPVWVVTM